jgi:hypothetical protein
MQGGFAAALQGPVSQTETRFHGASCEEGLPLHRRGPWVPGGTVPQGLLQGKVAVAPQRQMTMAKRMRMGDPPLPGTWFLKPVLIMVAASSLQLL